MQNNRVVGDWFGLLGYKHFQTNLDIGYQDKHALLFQIPAEGGGLRREHGWRLR